MAAGGMAAGGMAAGGMAGTAGGMHPATVRLMQREQWAQRTPEWYAIRRGLLTASDAASALDVKPYASYRGSARAELLKRKLSNAPLNNMFVAHGQKYEDEARDWAAAALGETVVDVGLVRHATLPWLAASPDGVTHTGKLVEIKCPLKRALEPAGHVPGHYLPQVQVQMEVCDVDSTLFVQYKPANLSRDGRAHLDVVVVERDRAWFAANEAKLKAFWEEYMEARDATAEAAADAAAGGTEASLCDVVDDMYSHMSRECSEPV